jgi:hypothetical protein
MRTITHSLPRVGVQHRPVTDPVLPDPAADLHHHRDVLAIPNLILPP